MPQTRPTPTTVPEAWGAREVFLGVGNGALASTIDGGVTYLHAVGQEEGGDSSVSFYARTANEGRTWGQRQAVDPLAGGGDWPRIAAAGGSVYMALGTPRCEGGIGVLRNRDHGRRGAWSALTCVTRTPSLWQSKALAATGRLVYVVSTSEARGRVAVHVSRDRGRTWTRVPLGFALDEMGDAWGPVEVAATGRLAAVAWTDQGKTYVRVSGDEGRHWEPATELADGSVTSASGRDGRLALSGGGEGAGWIYLLQGGDWHFVAPPSGAGTAAGWETTTVAIGPMASLAVVFVAVRPDAADSWMGSGCGSDLMWAMSDEGAAWGTPERVSAPVGPEEEACVSTPSVAWTGAERAFVLYDVEGSWTSGVLAARGEAH